MRRADAIVSSNTSGIPIASIAEGRSRRLPPSLARHALLQSAALPAPARAHSDARDRSRRRRAPSTEFADHRLGKGVVVGEGHAGFIANRIGLYGVDAGLPGARVGRRCTIEEVDAITGPAIGRPKSATFRTLDIAGVDVLAHVARTLGVRRCRRFVTETDGRAGMTGEKAGAGVLQAKAGGRDPDARSATLEYRPKQPAKLPSLDAARVDRADRRAHPDALRRQGQGRRLPARHARSRRSTTPHRIADEIAYSRDDVDRAMRWGFGWELGPFETDGRVGAAELPASGSRRSRLSGSAASAAAQPRRSFEKNAGASLVDLGDGVLASSSTRR